jgi:O-methyltransferase
MKKKLLNELRIFLEKKGYYFYKPTKVNNSIEFEIGDLSYGPVFPKANYSPWRNDKQFMAIYNTIKDHTLVDMYRCYELWKLVDEVVKISDTLNFIEIGVWRGGTAAIMSKKLENLKGKGKIFLADTFTGVVKTGDMDTYYTGGEHKDTSKDIVVKLLSETGGNNFEILQGIFPDDTAHLIPKDLQFGLCHIDVDVYLSAKGCIDWVWDKLAIGGMVVFDDYGFHTCDGVAKLVEEQRKYKDRIVIHNLNGHGLVIKIK